MDYGCDVSNRYTGYLDSSDHGNSMSSFINKNKRKTKKKRKPKNQNHKLVDKCINTEQSDQCIYIEPLEQSTTPEVVGMNDTADKQQSFSTDNKSEVIEPIQLHDTESNITADFQKSSSNCDSPMQSDTTHDEVKDTNEKNTTMIDLNAKDTKWSEICFEEEKTLMAMESQSNDDNTQKAINEPELMFNEHRVYPTIYFYNSNFGNRIQRAVDWHNSGRRSRNDSEINRNNDANRNNDTNKSNDTNRNNDEKKPRRRNRPKYQKRRQKYQTTETDDKNHQSNCDGPRSDDGKHTDSHNSSNEHTSQQTNEHINEASNRRESINSKNNYKKFNHGMPERNFTRRRRPDFVRNV